MDSRSLESEQMTGSRTRASRTSRLISMASSGASCKHRLLLLIVILFSCSLTGIKGAATATDDSLILMDESSIMTEEPCPCPPETEKCCPFLVCCKIDSTAGDAAPGPHLMSDVLSDDTPPTLSQYDIKLYAWTIITVSLSLCFLLVICLFWPICPLYYSTVCYVKYHKDVAGCADQYGEIPAYFNSTSMPCEDPPLGNVLIVSHQPSLMTPGKDREVAV